MELETQPSFFQQKTKINIARAKLFATIAIILESFLLIRNFVQYGVHFDIYNQLYLLLIIVSAVLVIAINIIEQHNCLSKFKIANRILFFYYLFTLCWGVIITLLDQQSYGHVTAYLINLLITATFFITSPRTFYALHCLPLVFLFFGFYIYFPNSIFIEGHIINILIFFTFVTIGTRIIYIYTKKSYEQEQQLCAQNNQLSQLNNSLEYLVQHDTLTGLYNRHYLHEQIQHKFQHEDSIALWIIDIDYFKAYNDYYGHLQGDAVLKQVASILDNVAQLHSLTPVRLGGEEFLLVGFGLDETLVSEVAETLRKQVELAQIVHEQSSSGQVLTVSVGYVHSDISPTQTFSEILEAADKALYISKKNGRNRTFTLA